MEPERNSFSNLLTMPPGLFNKTDIWQNVKTFIKHLNVGFWNDELMDYNCGILMIKEITLI